jgi:hypothetical protein
MRDAHASGANLSGVPYGRALVGLTISDTLGRSSAVIGQITDVPNGYNNVLLSAERSVSLKQIETLFLVRSSPFYLRKLSIRHVHLETHIQRSIMPPRNP